MKIYNEIIMKFNELTGTWDTLSEDSFEDAGPISLARRRRRKRKKKRGGFFKKLKKRARISKKAKRRIRKAVTPSRKRRKKIGRGLLKGIKKVAKASRKIRKRVRPSRKLRKLGRKIKKRVRPSRKLRKIGRKLKRRISPSRKIRKRLGLKSKKRVVRKKVRSRRRPTSRRKPTRRKGFGLKPGRGKIRRGGRKAVRRRVGKRGGRRAARKGRGGSLAARLGLKIKRSAALKARRRRPKPTRKIRKRRAKPVRARVRSIRALRLKRRRIPRKKAPNRKMKRAARSRASIARKLMKRIKRKPRPQARGRRLSFPVMRIKKPRIPKWRPRGAPANAIFLSRRIDGYGGRKDVRRDVMKWTQGYFTGGDGTLEGMNTYTASFKADKKIHENIPVPDGTTLVKEITKKNEEYYFNIANTHPNSASCRTQFSVTYGHCGGSGSDVYGDGLNPNTLQGETEQIYKQFANILLFPEEADVIDNGTDGFKISATATAGGAATGKRDDYIWILVGKRARMRDKMNKKAWTLKLQGSGPIHSESQAIYLTDDSANQPYTPTPAGPRYNIVSGTAGYVTDPASTRTYGWFYPEMGTMVFSGIELGHATTGIPGPAGSGDLNASFLNSHNLYSSNNSANAISTSCFTPNLNVGDSPNNALRFVNCMRAVGTGTTLRLRNELDRTQIQYFCRVKNNQMNHSNNPTFTSGSAKNTIRNKTMRGNPQTYITSVGLWNRKGQLIAIAKLSKPALKNFVTEATIKIMLEF